MRKLIFYILFILLSISIYAQEKMGDSHLKINLSRSLYMSGQDLKITVFLDTSFSMKTSKFIFADLISSENNWIIGSKYEVSKNMDLIEFHLPEQLISGIYLLRVYTDFNKNSNLNIQRIAIKIVNPYNPKTLGCRPLKDSVSIKSKPRKNLRMKTKILENSSRDSLVLFSSKDMLKDIQQIIISINPISTNHYIPFNVEKPLRQKQKNYQEDGLILSGNIHNRITNLPLANEEIHLVISQLKNIFFAISDSMGDFHFNLAYSSGTHSIYINLKDTSLTKVAAISVNRDFLPAESFATYPFSLDNAERKTLLQWAQSKEVEALFVATPKVITSEIPFYGHADRIIVLDDYVDLFTLKDYFTQLPGNVNVRRESGKYKISLAGDDPQLAYREPLILLDYIPVYDVDKILKLNISEIQRYEIVNEVYVKDSKVFGGILNLISRRGDFAQYKFPPSAQFTPFTLLSNTKTHYMIDVKAPSFTTQNSFWQIKLNENHSDFNLTLPLPKIAGKYILKIVYFTNLGLMKVEEKMVRVE